MKKGIDRHNRKAENSFLVNTGMYIVEPEVIEGLEYNKPFDFPDIIKEYMNKGKKIGIYPISENKWMDMGQFDELDRMRRKLGYEE